MASTLLLGSLIGLPSVLSGTGKPASANLVSGPGGGIPAPDSSSVTPTCGVPDPGSTLGPAASLPSNPVSVLASGFSVLGFTVTSQAIYVFDGTNLRTYSLSGTSEGSFPLPSAFTGSNIAADSGPFVDSSGDIWMDSYYGDELAKFSPTGQVLWSSTSYPNSWIFSFDNSSGFQIALTLAGQTTSPLLSDSGQPDGSFPVALGGYVSQEPNGDLLVANNGHITTYSVSGSLVSQFGSSESAASGSYTGQPYHFFYQGGAVEPVQGGPIFTADPISTFEETSPQGYLESTTTLGGSLAISNYGALYLVGGNLYFAGGGAFSSNQNISSVPLSVVEQYMSAPSAAPQTLGWGAGITSGTPGSRVAGNYFSPGTSPSFFASFDPWWISESDHLSLSYSVWSSEDVLTGDYPTPTSVPLPTTTSGLADIPISIPPQDDSPGPYQLQAELWDDSTSPPSLLGATCAPYSVGAAGDALDFGTLPSGIGYGGPSDPRAVALNAQLGLDGLRGASISWSDFLPNCNASAPTAATCGASAMTFTNAPQSYFKAAYLAQQDHVRYWIQVTGGDPVSAALVSHGWWQGDIQSLVSFYSNTSNCTESGGECAAVTAWEPWNEANNTFSSNGQTFVDQVQEPFYEGVKAAAPNDTVIGGSSIGVSVDWWQQVVTAGGLSYMDAVGVHPYTSNNESWEEAGTISQVRQLQQVLGPTPIWFTEIGWWSDGPYNFLHQANTVARAVIWQKVLGIPVWNYFFDEGGWGDNGISYSLIQAASTDDYVKPSALAVMEASSELAGRAFLSSPSTGIPQSYEATFGPTSGGSHDLAAVWTDGLSVSGVVTLTSPSGSTIPLTVTSQWGASTSQDVTSGQSYSLPMSGQVTYLLYPKGDTLSVGPTESYAGDVALSSGGATAIASSSTPPCCGGITFGATSATDGSLTSKWQPSATDSRPVFTVTFPETETINRVIVDGTSIGSTVGGPRDYSVSLESPAGTWSEVAAVTGEFYDHAEQIDFSPASAQAIRISIRSANYSGYEGGGVPYWWGSSTPVSIGIYQVGVYAGTSAPSVLNGSSLQSLVPTPASIPDVYSLSPSNGPSSGGTSVTIEGQHFDGVTKVLFGSKKASSFEVLSPTVIDATAPAGTEGSAVPVSVTATAGTNATGPTFTYTPPPAVSSVSPDTGPSAGGTTVTVSGTGFTNATAVDFSGTPATSFSVVSATELTAVAPVGSGVEDVTVTTPSGTSVTSASDEFTYPMSPVVTSVIPAYIAESGGTSLTLGGSDLGGATQVSFTGTTPSTASIVGDGNPGCSGNGGPASAALTTEPGGVAVDGSGDVFFASGLDGVIREVEAKTGTVRTVAGENSTCPGNLGQATSTNLAHDNTGYGLTQLALSANGSTLYFPQAGQSLVYEEDLSTGGLTVIAGNGTIGAPETGVPARQSPLDVPTGIAVDSSGNVFFAEPFANIVQMVPASSGTSFGQSMTGGDLYTIAGTGTQGDSGDGGLGTLAEINSPGSLAIGPSGNLYIAEGPGSVRKLSAQSGNITTVFGGGSGYSSGQPANQEVLGGGPAMAVDSAGDLFVAGNNPSYIAMVPKVSGTYWGQTMTAGDAYTIAGNGSGGYSGDGGIPLDAEYGTISQIGLASGAGIYAADTSNDAVRFFGYMSASVSTISADSSTATTVQSPPLVEGTYDVQVTATSGTTPDSPLDQVASIGTPEVSSVSPSIGPSGTSVTVQGSWFDGVSNVLFGQTPATSWSVNSSGVLVAVAPSGTNGETVDVRVVTPAGTSSVSATDEYTFGSSTGGSGSGGSTGSGGGSGNGTGGGSGGSGGGSAGGGSSGNTPGKGHLSTRLAGQNGPGTSVAVAQAEFPNAGSAGAVVLARSDRFSDALAGGPFAASVDGPLLITPGGPSASVIDPSVLAEIEQVLPTGGTVYLLGGPLALPNAIQQQLTATGFAVERIWGQDAAATAVAIAKRLGNPHTVFEVTGTNFPDALSAVPAAIVAHGAILLTDGPTQNSTTAAYLAAHPNDVRYAIGGPLAAAGADPTAIAVYGNDRYATAAAVAANFFPAATTYGVATGENFPDALSGGVLMGTSYPPGPILLVRASTPLPTQVSSFLSTDQNASSCYIFGGPLAISNSVAGAL